MPVPMPPRRRRRRRRRERREDFNEDGLGVSASRRSAPLHEALAPQISPKQVKIGADELLCYSLALDDGDWPAGRLYAISLLSCLWGGPTVLRRIGSLLSSSLGEAEKSGVLDSLFLPRAAR